VSNGDSYCCCCCKHVHGCVCPYETCSLTLDDDDPGSDALLFPPAPFLPLFCLSLSLPRLYHHHHPSSAISKRTLLTPCGLMRQTASGEIQMGHQYLPAPSILGTPLLPLRRRSLPPTPPQGRPQSLQKARQPTKSPRPLSSSPPYSEGNPPSRPRLIPCAPLTRRLHPTSVIRPQSTSIRTLPCPPVPFPLYPAATSRKRRTSAPSV
jgi:hypothetical protein